MVGPLPVEVAELAPARSSARPECSCRNNVRGRSASVASGLCSRRAGLSGSVVMAALKPGEGLVDSQIAETGYGGELIGSRRAEHAARFGRAESP